MSGTNTDPLVPGGAPPPGQGSPPGQLPLPATGTSPPPGDPPPVVPPASNKLELTSDQLNERLDRAKKSERAAILKSLGFDSEEAAKAAIQQAEAHRQAQLTKEQRLEEQLNQERTLRQQHEARAAELEFTSELTRLCAARGIKDFDYARYLVEKAAEGHAQFDAGAFLDQELQTPARRLALGVDGPATVVADPATTSPHNPNRPPPAPAQNGSQPVNVMTMTKAEADAYTRQKYGV